VSINACAALVEAGDPDRFLAAMAAPVDVRGRLFVLYALNLEVAKAPFVTKEPMIAEMRLQFWRDTIADAAAGKAVRAHEVAAPLAALIHDMDLDVNLLDQMIAARRFDIYPNDADQVGFELDGYLRRTAGHLMGLSATACGASTSDIAAAMDVGEAMGIALWLRAVPDLVGHNRVAAGDLDSDTLIDHAQRGLSLLRAHRSVRFGPAVPALRAAWMTAPILRQVVADPRRVIDGTLGLSDFRKKGNLLMRSLTNRW
jgi:phytoene/squalene synthetase